VIARLDGTLFERMPPHVVIDCNGVGYDVIVSAYTLAALPPDGERVTLRIFTHATENKLALFGFFEVAERQLFDALITVKNVGPTTAVAILSGSSPRDIAQLIANEDVAGLTRIKGVGKKTAELLVVELKDRCAELVLGWDASGGLRPAARPSSGIKTNRHPLVEEVALALVGMGWRPNEAEAAASSVPGDLLAGPGATIEVALRHALRSMPR
jgi:Holliday junction DNA helicase RuvA